MAVGGEKGQIQVREGGRGKKDGVRGGMPRGGGRGEGPDPGEGGRGRKDGLRGGGEYHVAVGGENGQI